MQRVDRTLGRLLLRSCAVLAFSGAAASTVFGAVVLVNGHFAGILALMLGAFFLWLGLRAWRDRATLGEVLNRDFEKMPTSQPETHDPGQKTLS
jgi:hypothetical protein